MGEGNDKDSAVAIAYHWCKEKVATTDAVSTAIITKEGWHVYADGVRFKKWEDIDQAFDASSVLPVFSRHDEAVPVGVAYSFEKDAELKEVRAKLYPKENFAVGDSVSLGFYTKEVPCKEGTCQTEISNDHVAASSEFENRVPGCKVIDKKDETTMSEDMKKVLDAKEVELTVAMQRVDSLEKELAEKDKVIDGYVAEKKASLIAHLKGEHKITKALDGEDYERLVFLDESMPEPKASFADGEPTDKRLGWLK